MTTIDTTYNDIVDVISELHARGHVCDINAIEAWCHQDWLAIVNALKEMCGLGIVTMSSGEIFVIPQEV